MPRNRKKATMLSSDTTISNPQRIFTKIGSADHRLELKFLPPAELKQLSLKVKNAKVLALTHVRNEKYSGMSSFIKGRNQYAQIELDTYVETAEKRLARIQLSKNEKNVTDAPAQKEEIFKTQSEVAPTTHEITPLDTDELHFEEEFQEAAPAIAGVYDSQLAEIAAGFMHTPPQRAAALAKPSPAAPQTQVISPERAPQQTEPLMKKPDFSEFQSKLSDEFGAEFQHSPPSPLFADAVNVSADLVYPPEYLLVYTPMQAAAATGSQNIQITSGAKSPDPFDDAESVFGLGT